MTSAELVWRNAKTNFNGKVVKGHERKVFRSRRCDADSWDFKISSIQVMRQINSELEKKGYIVIRGKVSRKYFEERIYGMSDAG